MELIDLRCKKELLNLESIHEIAMDLTTESLTFSFKTSSSHPDRAFISGEANCVGYAALYSAIVNYILVKKRLNSRFMVSHLRGKIRFFSFDIHQMFTSDYFRDHDYNRLVDLTKKTSISSDASLADYSLIKYIYED